MGEVSKQMSLAQMHRLSQDQRAREEIYDCLVRFYRGVDRLDRELILSAYHPGARDNHGYFDGSAEKLADWICRPEKANLVSSTHHVGNVTMKIDGDVAHCETYVLITERWKRDGKIVDRTGLGRCLDRFEKRDGAWRIAERHVVLDSNRTDIVPPGAETNRMGLLQGTPSADDPSYVHFAGGAPA